MTSPTIFLRLTAEQDKATALAAVLENKSHPLRFEANAKSFQLIPGAPFAYWVSDAVLSVFRTHPRFEEVGFATSGTGTLSDERFLRLWFELEGAHLGLRWSPYAKGGAFSPHYFDSHLVVNWDSDGAEMKAWVIHRYGGGHWARNIRSTEHYFRPGLTWPRRTNGLSVRLLPAGCIFADKGPAGFVEGNDPIELMALCAIMNSRAFIGLVSLQLGRVALAQSFEVGLIQQTPIPKLSDSNRQFLADRARALWTLKQNRDQSEETSHVYLLPGLLMTDGPTLAKRASTWDSLLQTDTAEIERLQAEINEKCWSLYGIKEADQRALMNPGTVIAAAEHDGESEVEDFEEEVVVSITQEKLIESLASWMFGAAIGRWDADLATGKRQSPPLPGPLDQLPAVSRGMLIGADSLHPAKDASGRILPEHDLLVDDEGHGLDVVQRALAVMAQVAGARAEAWQQELEGLLGSDLRTWYRRTFFERHLKRHSKSRRNAPVYWQLGTNSGSYSVWLYYPRLTQDSIYRVLNETVKPKVQQEEQRLSQLRQTQARRSEVEAQENFVEELRGFQEEVARVAPLFDPNLDDGVLLNAAPLWRLTPHHGWRKDTKAAWEALAKGEYDWAHLALKLWPERVIPKCAKERHLALAHDLEGALKTHSVAALITHHTRPAVQEALAQLQAAPAIGGGGRGAKPKKAPGRPPEGTP